MSFQQTDLAVRVCWASVHNGSCHLELSPSPAGKTSELCGNRGTLKFYGELGREDREVGSGREKEGG